MSMTVCSECGRAYSADRLHLCPEKAEAAARGFEGEDSIIDQLKPPQELLTRVTKFNVTNIVWKWSVEVTGEKLDRVIIVLDPSLPDDLQERWHYLAHHEEWEEAFQVMGLLP